ncbi:hypothetical protein BLNAU_5460 [Blattamonas nauphoetae]|uniref:Uncharacterized protein n=1 Tax=Blattamonas nauphoetae TaxID=2049346 RepID=A0ABQ9Y7D9_9EUKA|nr:hypothetical protein BLNAU_5460 [Blattamonas nauphoetae]
MHCINPVKVSSDGDARLLIRAKGEQSIGNGNGAEAKSVRVVLGEVLIILMKGIIPFTFLSTKLPSCRVLLLSEASKEGMDVREGFGQAKRSRRS